MQQITLADLERLYVEAMEDAENFKQALSKIGEDTSLAYSMYLAALGEASACLRLAQKMKGLKERDFQLEKKRGTLFNEEDGK